MVHFSSCFSPKLVVEIAGDDLAVHLKTHIKGEHPSHYSLHMHADVQKKHLEVLKEDYDIVNEINYFTQPHNN